MTTKHELIMSYIEKLPVGDKISVRKVAQNMHVSEGTAYRAIKEAENAGFVSTIKRVGTIRIERKIKENIEKLTYAEILNMTDGQVLGGRVGLYKTLNRFVIGAMTIEAMTRYVEADHLIIVGNRENAQKLALEKGAAVLITGGFGTNEEVIKLADELEMPVISTSYDTFTVATLINRAIYDRLIKKEILFVSDILKPMEDVTILQNNDTVATYYQLQEETGHNRYPVVNKAGHLVGVISPKDISEHPSTTTIDYLMTRNPIVVGEQMTVPSVAHMMIWEGIELIPVVKENQVIVGLVSREDVLKAMQLMQRQPQIGETLDDTIVNQFILPEDSYKKEGYKFQVTPQMTNHIGTLSYGVLSQTLCEVVQQMMMSAHHQNTMVESMTIYFLKPIQMDSVLEFEPTLLEQSRKTAKIDITVRVDNVIMSKSLISVQIIER
ncbi:hypothetical protein BFR40_08085 [Brochothrix thermosphacta]|uniref:DRTGG domain-containing protein n=1 Tax=Brochothrix thermosphacta TaxID=2756 RepID=UPI00083FC6A7|nr:DRTGG domain-containing protein [Brochothrix thermosphacta]ODJ51025.1 hypothetical protein BFR40_08085 [Brochothrix thermosphacta]